MNQEKQKDLLRQSDSDKMALEIPVHVSVK